jgi:SAM-dependent methyltransferase
MSTSSLSQIPTVMGIIRELKPQSVLDVGAGYGKYGFLIREYLDGFTGRMHIDAVDPQVCPVAENDLYQSHYHEPFDEFNAEMRYDLVLMIDVLEHFTKDDGWKALDKALSLGKRVLVVTPAEPAPQEGEWEAHLSSWTLRELKDRYKVINKSNSEGTVMCLVEKL